MGTVGEINSEGPFPSLIQKNVGQERLRHRALRRGRQRPREALPGPPRVRLRRRRRRRRRRGRSRRRRAAPRGPWGGKPCLLDRAAGGGGEWAPAAGSAAGSPPPLSVDPVLAAHGPLIFSQARFVGYVSSTSVYGGDLGGERVDEFSKLKPDSAAGAARSRAEGEWREAAAATLFSSSRSPSTSSFPLQRLAIVRAGGIYGPGRSVLDSEEVLLADSVSPPPSSSESEANGGEKGSETDATSSSSSFISNPSRQQPHEANRPTARVHVLDLCRLLRAQAVLDEREGGGEEEGEGGGGGRAAPVVVAICNAVDGAPVPRSAALRAARELLGVQGGEKAGGEQDEQGGRRGEAPPGAEEARRGKVVSGERTWADAGIAPLFPSVFEGLRAILAGDARPFGEREGAAEEEEEGGGGARGGGRAGEV